MKGSDGGHRGVRSVLEAFRTDDDADLPVGAVRTRMKGSDGGHRGVRSVLEAFRTDAVPRVKVGVGRPQRHDQLAGHGRAAFAPEERPAVDKACAAADRVLEVIEEARRLTKM